MTFVNRDKQTISITQLSSPAVVNDVLYQLYQGRQEKGYSELVLDFQGCTSVFPNVCTPLAGILEFYRYDKDTQFEFLNVPQYVKNTHMLSPVVSGTADMNRVSPLNTVWKFASSEEVNEFVTAFVEEFSRSIVCEKDLLLGLEWCLNEVMDNVIQHASADIGMQHGYVMAQIHKESHRIAICVYDYGQGILNSLKDHQLAPKSSADAITMAIQEEVTRDKKIGQGNGLWGLQRIIQLNQGLLTIASGDTRLTFGGHGISKNEGQPYPEKNHQSTTVDFQLDFMKEISISEALNGYRPVNHRIEQLEDDITKTIPYHLKDQASGTGTRQSGEKIRNDILNIMKESSYRIMIDFTGISVVSSSFADELIGKLVIKLGFTGFAQRIQLVGMNDFIAPIVDRSVSQRMAEIFNKP